MIPIFTGKVDKGKLILENKEGFTTHYRTFEGKEIELVVRLKKRKRSDNQNRYYFGVCLKLLSDHFGYTVEELHEALKWKFLKVQDEVIDRVKSTTELSTIEFEDYLENIKRWAAELGVVIPDPNSVDYSQIQNYQ